MNNEKKAPVLTLAHLASYLPYGLKVVSKINNYSYTLLGACKDEILIQDDLNGWYATNIFKPILRPISDLYIYNEHFEESWISRLNKECIEFSNTHGIWLDSDLDFDIMYDRCEPPGYLPLEYTSKCRDWLVKNHFDVFGLIEKGLAIDINSIEGKETNNV